MSTIVTLVLSGWLAAGAPEGTSDQQSVDGASLDAAGQGQVAENTTQKPEQNQSPEHTLANIEKAETLTQEGWQLSRQGQWGSAEPKFLQAVRLDPESTGALNGLGWSRFYARNWNRAIEAFEKCIALAPDHAAALNGLGQIYYAKSDFKKALGYLNKAAPNAPASWWALAKIHLLEGNWGEAEKWCKKIVADQPENADARQMLAAAEANKLPDWLRRLIAPPKLPLSLTDEPINGDVTRAWKLFHRGRFRTAEVIFREQFKKYPNNFAAQNGLACCLKAEGKVDEALALWENLQLDNPGVNMATYSLAETYLEQKEYAKSIPYWEKIVATPPENAAAKASLEVAKAKVAEAKAKAAAERAKVGANSESD